MLTERHEQRLDEIEARTNEVSQRLQEADELLRRVEVPHPLVAFVHIPKTAGGTVRSIFATAYTKQGISKTGNYITGPEKTVSKVVKPPGGWETWLQRGGRLAIGHTPYGVFRDHLPPGTLYVTFLREPIDRVLSHYYRHVHNPALKDADPSARARARGRDKAASLEEALVEMRLPQLANLSTRFLCSHPTLGELPASALDDAKENLRKFAFVGLQERFDESVILLQQTLGMEVLPYLDRHVSAAGGRPAVDEVPDDDRALIEEYNQLDIELYEFGVQLFEEAVAVAGEGLAAEVEKLQSAQAAATEQHQAAVLDIRDWLDRELPPGTSKPVAEVKARSQAAGFSPVAVNEARRQVEGLKKTQGEDGVWVFARADEAQLAALEEACAWLDRELPAGSKEPVAALAARAEAAGVSRAALNQARKLLDIAKSSDAELTWTRPRAPSR